MVKPIKQEKMKEFLESFYNNPQEWYNRQIDEDFEFDEETQLKIIEEKFYVKYDDFAIQYIKNPTNRVCLETVKQDGYAIQYIKNPTEEMCLEAVKNDGWTIQFIVNPTEEMKLEAVKNFYASIRCIKKSDQSFEIVEAFFDHFNNGNYDDTCPTYYKYLAKKFITKEQGLIMIKEGPEYINLLSEEVQKEILEIKPELEKYIKKQKH